MKAPCAIALLALVLVMTTRAAHPATATQSASRAHPAISVTGCLKTSDEPRVFRLTGAVRADEEDDSGETPSAAGTKVDGKTYRLVPLGANVNLKQFLGHKVEVGGRFMSVDELHRAEKGDTQKDDAAKEGAASQKDKEAGATRGTPTPTIAVTFVRSLASTCTSSGTDK